MPNSQANLVHIFRTHYPQLYKILLLNLAPETVAMILENLYLRGYSDGMIEGGS